MLLLALELFEIPAQILWFLESICPQSTGGDIPEAISLQSTAQPRRFELRERREALEPVSQLKVRWWGPDPTPLAGRVCALRPHHSRLHSHLTEALPPLDPGFRVASVPWPSLPSVLALGEGCVSPTLPESTCSPCLGDPRPLAEPGPLQLPGL